MDVEKATKKRKRKKRKMDCEIFWNRGEKKQNHFAYYTKQKCGYRREKTYVIEEEKI